MTNMTRVSELTVAELLELLRGVVREVLVEQASKLDLQQHESLLDITPLSVGPWPDELKLISREEMYENADR